MAAVVYTPLKKSNIFIYVEKSILDLENFSFVMFDKLNNKLC